MKRCIYIFFSILLGTAGCRKVTYNAVSKPAYVRVFNSLNYATTLQNKDNPPPFLTMIIDPVFDAEGIVAGGGIVGDYLDKRVSYAPPYPLNSGSTRTVNNEYPGNEKVLVGPVVNGFDLSSWAQMPSGRHRIQFYNRTVSTVPFFQLPAGSRTSLLVDTTLTLEEGEVYTMQVLQRDIYRTTNIAELYVRKELFTKMPLADSLIYVNFYNLSAEGYATMYNFTDPGRDLYGGNNAQVIRDTMNIYYCLFTPDSVSGRTTRLIPGYEDIPLTTLTRSHQPGVASYHSIPLFPGRDTTGSIFSNFWQRFIFLMPAYSPLGNGAYGPYSGLGNRLNGNYAVLDCTDQYDVNYTGAYYNTMQLVPNLRVTTPSGNYPARSFSMINTVEWINNQVYLMSIQRQYPAPVNN
ncbi:MAG: hypothetical protein J0H74_08765 [Chitinophagaceae bacterium]|nr:hypothetical protein [Chitinophagaceae bacterium]